MALTSTTLASACDATQLTMKVTSASGATVGGFMRIDDEYSFITAISGTLITVRSRGDMGGTASAHTILAYVTFGLTSDMAALGFKATTPVPIMFDLKHLGANVAALDCPTRDTVFFINKASALGTTTLANPTADQSGLRVSFVNTTDYQHVVTVTTCQDGTTGNSTTLTSPAYAGGTITLIANAGQWYVFSNNLWVIT